MSVDQTHILYICPYFGRISIQNTEVLLNPHAVGSLLSTLIIMPFSASSAYILVVVGTSRYGMAPTYITVFLSQKPSTKNGKLILSVGSQSVLNARKAAI